MDGRLVFVAFECSPEPEDIYLLPTAGHVPKLKAFDRNFLLNSIFLRHLLRDIS